MEWLETIRLEEVLIVLFVVVLILGANRLPQLGEGLRESIENFLLSIAVEANCEHCQEPLRGSEFRCPECRRITLTGSSTLISLAAAVMIFGAALLSR